MTTTENDIVLIYMEDVPISFARIESILPDVKPNWYHVELLMLQVPPHMVSWILRDVYIDGTPFSMDGKQMRLEKVVRPQTPEVSEQDVPEDSPADAEATAGTAEVISFSDLKKNSS